ncbi:MAG TPA: sugar ABC transporter permease [Treponema sp.]|nr:sugar ABC transporter permease [Treponema sp.]
MKQRNYYYRTGPSIETALKYAVLVFLAFWTLLPLASCFITAFKNTEEYNATSVMVLPRIWYVKNFTKAFQLADMGRAFINSAVVLAFVLAGSIIISSQLAYVLNRFKFPGNRLIRRLFLFATLLPGIAMQVAVYEIMGKLGFINHLYGYIIMQMGTDVISIYIFIQFMENISPSLDESAIIDGASYHTIYWKIILPLLKPAVVTSMILKGVATYNEYYCAGLYLQDTKIRTVAISLYTFTGPLGNQYNLICAGVIISLLPALVIFLLCQQQIYTGITAGAVKG